MIENWIKKGLTFAVIVLFICLSITPSYAVDNVKKSSTPIFNGNTLYVGGSGPDNYTRIQDAIDNATDGDTVFVYDDSSPYREKIEVNKSIHLLGEYRYYTVIDGGEYNYKTIFISADEVRLEGFTIHGGVYIEANCTMVCNNSIDCGGWNCIDIGYLDYGSPFYYNNSIVDNKISGYDGKYINYGIANTQSQFTRISRNIISMDGSDIESCAIMVDLSGYCIISENTLIESNAGILFYCSNKNSVFGNIISGNNFGIYLFGEPYYNGSCDFNTLYRNTITSNNIGIFLDAASSNIIKKNNFLNNSHNAFFNKFSLKNQWMRNYWDRPRLLPKIIFGQIQHESQCHYWINIDWHPKLLPINIKGG